MSIAAIHLFLVIMAASLLAESTAVKLRCYQCGVGLSQSCDVFEDALDDDIDDDLTNNTSVLTFQVPCRDQELCYKSVNDADVETRGCVPMEETDGDVCDDGTCICSTDLCNSANGRGYMTPMFIFTLLVGAYNL